LAVASTYRRQHSGPDRRVFNCHVVQSARAVIQKLPHGYLFAAIFVGIGRRKEFDHEFRHLACLAGFQSCTIALSRYPPALDGCGKSIPGKGERGRRHHGHTPAMTTDKFASAVGRGLGMSQYGVSVHVTAHIVRQITSRGITSIRLRAEGSGYNDIQVATEQLRQSLRRAPPCASTRQRVVKLARTPRYKTADTNGRTPGDSSESRLDTREQFEKKMTKLVYVGRGRNGVST